MMKVYEGFRARTAGDKVECLNCGATNQTGADACDNCDAQLERPASLLTNVIETIIRPQRAMARLAATMPVLQAFLVVIAMVCVYIIIGAVILQSNLEDILRNPGRLSTQERNLILAIKEPPIPGVLFLIQNFVFLPLSWLLFSLGMFYTARIIYKDNARVNFIALASIAGFARVTTLASLLFLFISTDYWSILSLLVLLWQLSLITIGVAYSTGLKWPRALLVVLIPAFLFRFFLQLPI